MRLKTFTRQETESLALALFDVPAPSRRHDGSAGNPRWTVSIRTPTARSTSSFRTRTARLLSAAVLRRSPNGGVSVTRNRIARLNPDDKLDTAFNANANNQAYCMVMPHLIRRISRK
jgi:hypothetical protein